MSLIEMAERMLPTQRRFFGKYRGTVMNNIDPQRRGRIQVLAPDVSLSAITSWALPCLPWGGLQTGLFTVPTVGAGVWVEFEQGDPDYPIWTGCYWGSASEVPKQAALAQPPIAGLTIQTPLQHSLQISDLPGPVGGIQLRSATGAMIAVTDVGIFISNGKGASINLVGNVVNVNNGALTIL